MTRYSNLKSRSQEKGWAFNLTADEFKKWQDEQPNTCYYCGREFQEKRGVFSRTIDRKDNNRGYEIDNIVSACASCNSSKSTGEYEPWLIKRPRCPSCNRAGYMRINPLLFVCRVCGTISDIKKK